MKRAYKRTRARRVKGRRRYGRRYRRRGKMPIARVGLPATMKINHVYAESVYFNPAAPVDSQIWRVNSLFDPNYSGVGGQPALYDNLNAMYRRYRVVACKIKTEFFNTTNDSLIVSLIYQGTNATAIPDPSTYFPEGRKGNRIITLDRVGTGGANKTITTYFNLAKLEAPNVLTSVNYAGAGADPPTPLYASVNVASVGSTNVTCYIRTTLTFYTRWESPHQLENLLED